jgi:hypothetical protein
LQTCLELAFLAINPKIKIIAPWRIPEFYNRFQGRNDLLDYAAATGIPVTSTKAKPYSMDDNIAHCSYEAGLLEDPSITPPDDMWTRTVDPRSAPDEVVDIAIIFKKGLPVKLTAGGKVYTDSLEIFIALNEIGKKAGIGRIDIVEVRQNSPTSISLIVPCGIRCTGLQLLLGVGFVNVLRWLIRVLESLYRLEKPRLLRFTCYDNLETRTSGCRISSHGRQGARSS